MKKLFFAVIIVTMVLSTSVSCSQHTDHKTYIHPTPATIYTNLVVCHLI